MWRPWSRALELLGRFRTGGFHSGRVRVGHPSALDAQGSWRWRDYRRSEALYDVWGPLPGSPWLPFHCVPLFAALDRVPEKDIGPTPTRGETDTDAAGTPPGATSPATSGAAPAPRGRGTSPYVPPPGPPPELPAHARPRAAAPRWLNDETWTILDLPGALTIEAATWLITAAKCQPVCTFDNWPHPRGVLQPQHTLAELLRWASTIADARPALTQDSPPLWICDSERLGRFSGKPGDFDNRYYLDDSILPGPALLQRAGIRRVVYVTLGTGDVPVADLEPIFAELLAAGLPVLHLDLADATAEPRPFASPPTARRPPRAGFRRSSAGGFGTEVPEPSSGSGGGS